MNELLYVLLYTVILGKTKPIFKDSLLSTSPPNHLQVVPHCTTMATETEVDCSVSMVKKQVELKKLRIGNGRKILLVCHGNSVLLHPSPVIQYKHKLSTHSSWALN